MSSIFQGPVAGVTSSTRQIRQGLGQAAGLAMDGNSPLHARTWHLTQTPLRKGRSHWGR